MPYEGEFVCVFVRVGGGVYNACLTKVRVCLWGVGVYYNACLTKVRVCLWGVGCITMHALRR